MALKSGLLTYAAFGEETTYGTAATRNRFLPFTSESIKPVENKVMTNDLYLVGQHAGRRVQSNVTVEGDITFKARYNSTAFQRLLKHALGSVATAQPDITNAPTVYRHTFTPADTLPTGLTVEIVKDTVAFVHTGLKIPTLRMSFTQGDLLECVASFIGRQTIDGSPPTPFSMLEGTQIALTNAVLTWDGGTQKVTAGDLTISNPQQYIYTIGSRFTDEPFRNAKREISGTFTAFFEDVTIFSHWRNLQRKQLILTATGDLIGGGFSYDLQITLPVSEVINAYPASNSEGPHMHDVEFLSQRDDVTTNEISVRLTNTNTTA